MDHIRAMAPATEGRRPEAPSTRQEELQIALQVAHEVNGHLNREVEKLTLQVEALQQERNACLEHIKFLSHKMAEERRKAAEHSPGKAEAQAREELQHTTSDTVQFAAAGENGDYDDDWLHDAEWQRMKNMGMQRGWLIDPQEVILGEMIGKGSFGTTYRGTWRGGLCAVKCIRVTSRSEAVSFLREVEALSLVRHANVMPMYGACIDPPHQCWLVCEYLPGGNLATWLYGQGRRLPEHSVADRVRMALDVARGMQALEQCNPPILHRDLKPSNVFIDSAGNARVADMGLARVLTPEAMVSLTGETGTYIYMSPECIRHELYDTRSDVWSFGVLLVEMLTQQKPYASLYATPVQVAIQVAEGQLHPLIPPNLDHALEELLLACFDPDPMGRPSFGIIVVQLARIADNMAKQQQAEAAVESSWGKWLGGIKGKAVAAAAAAPPLLKRPVGRGWSFGGQDAGR